MTTPDTEVVVGYRHVYTWARTGAQGSPGFQTIACARQLEEAGNRRAVEQAVNSFDSTIHPPGSRVRQVVPVEGIVGASALTVFLPRGKCGDGRPGNYLAETVVVSNTWLKKIDWDVDAVLGTLDWRGETWLPELSGGMLALADEELPRSLSCPLHRLSHLASAIPRRIFVPLVVEIANGGRQRVFLKEAPGSSPDVLDRLLPLLPLTLPPPLRSRRHGGRDVPLGIRTRGRSHDVPSVLVQGLAESAPATDHGTVFDLAPNSAVPQAGDLAGKAYAEWLWKCIELGAWEPIEQHYRQAAQFPTRDPLTGMPEPKATVEIHEPPVQDSPPPRSEDPIRRTPYAVSLSAAEVTPAQRPEPAVSAPAPSPEPQKPPAFLESEKRTPAILEDQRDDWRKRRIIEHEAWKVTQELDQQSRQLIETLRKDLEAHQKKALAQLDKELEAHRNAMNQKIQEATSVLADDRERVKSLFTESQDRLRAHQAALNKAQAAYSQEIDRLISSNNTILAESRKVLEDQRRALEENRKSHVVQIKEYGESERSNLRQEAQSIYENRSNAHSSTRPDEGGPLTGGQASFSYNSDKDSKKPPWPARLKKGWTSVQDVFNNLFRSKRTWFAALVMLLASLGGAGWYWDWFGMHPGTDGVATGGGGSTGTGGATGAGGERESTAASAEVEEVGGSGEALEHRAEPLTFEEVTRALEKNEVARKLLSFCDPAEGAKPQVVTACLQARQALIAGQRIGESPSLAILQAMLGISADGDWGPTTSARISSEIQATELCAAEEPIDAQKACLVKARFQLDRRCDVAWPIRVRCKDMTHTEAQEVLLKVYNRLTRAFNAMRQQNQEQDKIDCQTSSRSLICRRLEEVAGLLHGENISLEFGEQEAAVLLGLASRIWGFNNRKDGGYSAFLYDIGLAQEAQ